MKGLLLRIATVVILTIVSTNVSQAHQPAIESGGKEIQDPTQASQAIYGVIDNPGEIDEYSFTALRTTKIPVEVLVPVRKSNSEFHPAVDILWDDEEIVVDPPEDLDNRETFYEVFGQEKYWNGNEVDLEVKAGETYRIVVYDPNMQVGSYTLGLGSVEDFSDVNFFGLLSNVFYAKVLHTNVEIDWTDTIAVFLSIAGLIIGLGATTVIDILGFLGRKSKYWTTVTIKAHKVTKPLIWLGVFVHLFGLSLLYRQSLLSGVAFFQLIILTILIINGLFLSFFISPKLIKMEKDKKIKVLPDELQRKIFISFVISFLGWWSEVFLTIWQLIYLL